MSAILKKFFRNMSIKNRTFLNGGNKVNKYTKIYSAENIKAMESCRLYSECGIYKQSIDTSISKSDLRVIPKGEAEKHIYCSISGRMNYVMIMSTIIHSTQYSLLLINKIGYAHL